MPEIPGISTVALIAPFQHLSMSFTNIGKQRVKLCSTPFSPFHLSSSPLSSSSTTATS